ncbi:MAG: RNA polymerase sigma factor, partial [Verrucomicrobiae bacterium]|nr:RNA polymerase sigma factor [Verrucomicrobiae bacterium]
RDFEAGGRFSTWLWRIAINLCHDENRRRMRHPECPLETTADDAPPDVPATDLPTPSQVVERLEQAEIVRRALLRLPESQRSVVLLRHYEGLKFTEIAEVLGIPEGTVKSPWSPHGPHWERTRLGRPQRFVSAAWK